MDEKFQKHIHSLSKEQLVYILEEIIRIKPEIMDRGITNLIKYVDIPSGHKVTGVASNQWKSDDQYNGVIDWNHIN